MTRYRNFIWSFTGEPQEMLVEDGRVIARGSNVGSAAEEVDLQGRYLVPGFVDAHCHVLPMGLDLQKLHLGDCDSHDDVLQAIRDRDRDQRDGWLLAVHYDQTRYGSHLHRDQLDAVVRDRPVLLRHVSGHASVANSAALVAAGVSEDTKDPDGGSYVRDESGRLTGVLLEHAHETVTSAVPTPTLEEMVDAILRAGMRMRSWGIVGACDMMTGRFDLDLELQAYDLAASRGCEIETRLYVQWREVFGRRGIGGDELLRRSRRVAGIKIFADGAIGSATAAIYGRYSGEPAAGPVLARHGKVASHESQEVSGQLIYIPERLHQMVRTADEAGFQVATHTIGDYATDLVMDAYAATGEPGRHRIDHAMLLSDEQVERLHGLGCDVTFQPEFLMRFGHAYLRQLGPERTSKIKRTRTLLDAGIPLAFSSDLPIVNGNPLDGIQVASDRPSAFDPSENCTREEAFRLYTEASARVGGFGGLLGTLAPGEKAEWVAYESDPLRT